MTHCWPRLGDSKFLNSTLALAVIATVLSTPAGAQLKAPRAAVSLTAVLSQSLTVSAAPDGAIFNWFLSSPAQRNFPLRIKANWVRGPGQVSFAAFISSAYGDEQRVFTAAGEAGLQEIEIDSSQLMLSEHPDDGVLTLRAQVI